MPYYYVELLYYWETTKEWRSADYIKEAGYKTYQEADERCIVLNLELEDNGIDDERYVVGVEEDD